MLKIPMETRKVRPVGSLRSERGAQGRQGPQDDGPAPVPQGRRAAGNDATRDAGKRRGGVCLPTEPARAQACY